MTPDLQEKGNIWLKHIFYPLAHGQTLDPDSAYVGLPDLRELNNPNKGINPARTIYDCITNQTWEQFNPQGHSPVTDAIIEFAKRTYSRCPLATPAAFQQPDRDFFGLYSDEIAEILADMCKKCGIIWDDMTHTQYELEYFKKTHLGAALWNYKCFTSQNQSSNSTQAQSQTQANTSSTTASASSASSPVTSTSTVQNTQTKQTAAPQAAQPATGKQTYRSTIGGMPGSARGLVGAAGQAGKYYPAASEMYRIIDKTNSIGNKECRAFIKPLSKSGASSADPAVNAVLVGTSHNKFDCDCYFEDPVKAESFKQQLEQIYPYPFKLTPYPSKLTLELKQIKTHQRGYYLAKTNLGDCYIRAYDLNEELNSENEQEDSDSDNYSANVNEELITESDYSKNFSNDTWEEFNEKFDEFLG